MRAVPPPELSSLPPRPIKVALVDDQVLVRSGFAMVIEAEDDFTVVGEAGDGLEAIDLLKRVPVDVMLMDIRMPRMNGLDATKQIVANGWPVRIIILTTFDLDEYVYQALRAGASGFLLKEARATELVDAIRTVAIGNAIVAPSITRRLLANMALEPPRGQVDARLSALTDRERDVLVEIAKGLNNAEIADTLHLAEGTVKTHISRLLSKLQIRDRVGLVLTAYDMGLVER